MLALVLLCATPAPLEQVAEQMRQVQTLEAHMTQEKRLGAFDEVMRAEGTLYFERPRKLAMDLGGDGAVRIVIADQRMLVHYKAIDKREVTELARDPRAGAVAQHLFMLLGADPNALEEIYHVELLNEAPVTVRLVPKAEALAKVLEQATATFDSRGFVRELVVNESGGDVTTWRFVQAKVNQKLPRGAFAIEAK